MTITVKPTHSTLGAIVTDVELENLSKEDAVSIKRAFLDFGVLIFPAQELSAEGQVAFCENFGTIEFRNAEGKPLAVTISNVNREGEITKLGEHVTRILRGNEGWHTDSSYMPLAAKASCLAALTVPEHGGGTGWADMRAAYDALDEKMRNRVEALSALHSLYASQSHIGHTVKPGQGYGFHKKGAPLRSLVKVHPETGRKALYCGRHAYYIPGMQNAEARELLHELVEFACRPPRTLEHEWQVGDVAIWDNRCVLHRACPYDYDQPRILRHVRVAGEASSEFAETMLDERVGEIEETSAAISLS